MRIIYNGVDLFVQETYQYDMECVLDDSRTDYLYTRHFIVCRAIVNGQAEVFQGRYDNAGNWFRNGPAITYAFSGGYTSPVGGPVEGVQPPGTDDLDPIKGVGPGPVNSVERPNPVNPVAPVAPFGDMPNSVGISAGNTNQLYEIEATPNSPTFTLATIRHRLTTPRGRLFIFSGGWNDEPPAPVALMSPQNGFRTDCKNGPVPRILSITQAFGDATLFMLDFAIETYVNESKEQGVYKAGVLLSNRFSQSHNVDENSYTTISTSGVAIFRTDLIYSLPYSPDQERPILSLPIPLGFIRGNIKVEGIPDVSGVSYSFMDRQMAVNFTAAPYIRAASISALHRQAITTDPAALDGVLNLYERYAGLQANRNIARARPDEAMDTRTGVPTSSGGKSGTAKPPRVSIISVTPHYTPKTPRQVGTTPASLPASPPASPPTKVPTPDKVPAKP